MSETSGAERSGNRLTVVMYGAFLLLLVASLTRYLLRHGDSGRAGWVIGLSVALALAQLPELPWTKGLRGGRVLRIARLALVAGLWTVLVLLAPSFAWCAVPLIYTALRTLPAKAAVPLVAVLTGLVMYAENKLTVGIDPVVLLAPPAVAGLATVVFLQMERQAERQRALIADLVSTRRALADTNRREGVLAERQRLAIEIHDTLAQGLSSQQMLLQAADRVWDSDPATARTHVHTATSIAARSLAEARRFVRDLTPADLAGGVGLDRALRTLADREAAESGLTVRCHLEGAPAPLPDAVRSALLRIAQGALANVREHSGARTAALTLSYLGDQVVLDIGDDGRGLPPAPPDSDADPSRGHGLPAMRARVRQLGGTLTVESTPGEGTVITAAIPLEGPLEGPTDDQ
ncbi:sensor histidine kinase [Kitasatospora sp. NPDC051853]|uniref:sensor histidine kinase n=1 Tax=Kitasatospora sp. NPDC051853 TaxID=3364058 RepID=UPI00379E44E5